MNPNYSEFKFPNIRQHPWSKVFRSKTPPEAIDLISRLLVYNPARRLSPIDALQHTFFDELREQSTRLPNGSALPPLFDFTAEEIKNSSQAEIDNLIPDWYKE